MHGLSSKQCHVLARNILDDISIYCAEHAADFLAFKESLEGSGAYEDVIASGGAIQPHEVVIKLPASVRKHFKG